MYANHAFFLQFPPETGAVPLKLGHKHFGREITKSVALVDAVADSRKARDERALEPAGRSHP